ncbi:Eukaryotic translation initiation factor 2A [Astathelohania contejeani]|uniref:Eukaryotic translation initiation factor 2A n=1 Tax=Astathelohania contejeani TaxID=164912 RepID=A0ABQ7HWD8_9MICR|nr:Eukaryotic translation initiation factor 2A [Thelohania contejeani]
MNKNSIVALSENGLQLDILKSPESKIKCERCDVDKNIILYSDAESVNFHDGYKIIGTHKVTDVKQIKLAGKYGCALKYDRTMLVFDKDNILYSCSDVDRFKLSDKLVAYVSKSELFVCEINAHKISDIIFKKPSILDFEIFGNFFVFTTRKKHKNSQEIQTFEIHQKDNLVFSQPFNNIEAMKIKYDGFDAFIVQITTKYVNNSYFGASSLFFYHKKTWKEVKKCDNVHFFTFIEGGFAVCYGDQPADVVTMDYSLNVKSKFPSGIRNRIYYNPHFNLVCFAGFDNLSGDIELYDVKSNKLISKFRVLGASCVDWSPCGSYLSISITNFLKVDNKILVYDYYGRKLSEMHFEKLFFVRWIGEKENFMELEKPQSLNIDVIEHYVPPSLRNPGKARVSVAKKPRTPKQPAIKKQTPIKRKESIDASLLEAELEQIKNLKVKLERGENLTVEEMNKILSENVIKEKIQRKKQTINQ